MVTLGFASLVFGPRIAWTGGFAQVEYRLTFKSTEGTSLAGVAVTVESADGKASHFFPVTNFTPDEDPESDVHGVLRLNHVCSHAPEFYGVCRYLLFVIPVGTCEPPAYICRFHWRGKEIHRLHFADLNYEATQRDDLMRITRAWSWPEKRPDEFPWRLREPGVPLTESVEFSIFDKTIVVPD